MTHEFSDFDLPEGWTCQVDLKKAPEGTYAGKAELRQGRVQRCVFVLAQQPSREAALERVRFRARFFVDEWMTRPGGRDPQA
ncbi:hypothetical protein ACCC97_18840 [Variovorax sp. Varisp85]|jgi:hypothetical protein|uniref:hypothetical protein n=1 Tax=unclassified Variovorax TaxID=663243 RepID=UPI000270FB42|nr:hypothetical protein [Variovorax sp. CF313]EJL71925.1 hypothetical protein PMI12_04121 [Variovorax sp. CF313]